MVKGVKIRFEIHNILFSIYKFNKTLNNTLIKKQINKQKNEDIAFLHNVTLNSMRLHIHCLKIIDKFIKKKLRDHEKILLISAITQIVYLNFKEYAVINCSVEIAKKLKLYPGFINATLKKIAKDKNDLKQIKINFDDLPLWFQKKTTFLSDYEKKQFLKNFHKEPDVHIVFKDKEKLKKFDAKLFKTSLESGFLLDKKNFQNRNSFIKGDWWVQDFSSFLPLYNFKEIHKKKIILDACAAPGGKSFQTLSKKLNVVLNDKNKNRIQTLKTNLKRLKLSAKILNEDFIQFDNKRMYDVIIIDAPCSAVGTIRRNPEIFFKNKGPDFEKLLSLQENMLDKASFLLNTNGFIIYMTCSFLLIETINQVEKFLKLNNNFILSNFKLKENKEDYSKFIKNNFMITIPDVIFDYKIDG
ncbi:RsmB/NOP family class I SAM-dependent RNA methyltransferase, partial [Pelagibacteraceae bacterium]|nr:RsmB/NOP family class I SAM-dependent RNA methyltransferase [Pelagibacteraceae bacterium]